MTKNDWIEAALNYYDVKEDGTIRRHTSSKPLKPQINKSGYATVGLHINGAMKTVRVHRVVAAKFYGSSDLTVNHKDGNKLNNHKDNLEYLSSADNQKHYWATNPNPRPSRTKLSYAKAEEMRRQYRLGLATMKKLSEDYEVRYDHVKDIINNVYWTA